MAVSWMDPSTSPWFPHADGMTGAPRPQRDEGPVLVTADDVARTYGVAKRTVYYWAQTGALPSVRVGGSVRFDPDAVAKFMAPDDRPSEHVFATPSAVAPAIEAEGIVWAHGAARLSSAEAAEGGTCQAG